MAKLKNLTEQKNSEISESACRELGWLSYLMGDLNEAEKQGRRALCLKPDSQATWDLLFTCKFATDKADRVQWEEVYPLSKQQLDYLPTARNFLLLAKTCANLGRLDEAEVVLRTGLKQFPDDVACRLGLAAVLLLQNDRQAPLAEAKQCYEQVQEKIRDSRDRLLRENFTFNTAILAACMGYVDLSRSMFQFLWEHDPQFERSRDALKLFEN